MQGLCGIRKVGAQGVLGLFRSGISRYWHRYSEHFVLILMFSFVLSALNLLLCHLFLVQDAQSAINDLNGKTKNIPLIKICFLYN